MTKHKIIIEVEADEFALPLNVEDVRAGIAQYIDEYFTDSYPQHGWEETSALVAAIQVDGRPYDRESKVLEELPEYLTAEAVEHILNGRKIQAIKLVREHSYDIGRPLGLGEAKFVVDNYRPSR